MITTDVLNKLNVWETGILNKKETDEEKYNCLSEYSRKNGKVFGM